jgi:ABC-2 type transport system ATP-binding protein
MRGFIRDNLSRKRGKTVLYTTHYIEEAAQICDRIAIMQKGRLIALDTPDALRALTNKIEVLDVTVKNMSKTQVNALKGMNGVASLASDVQDATLGQTHLRLRLENVDTLPELFEFLFKEKIKIVNFKQEEPTLEDAFIELTGSGIKE